MKNKNTEHELENKCILDRTCENKLHGMCTNRKARLSNSAGNFQRVLGLLQRIMHAPGLAPGESQEKKVYYPSQVWLFTQEG